MGKRRYNDDKEDPGTCGFCKKSFETLSKFLRHVSHSKLCLEDYDATVIKSLKEKSRLKSKRKWFHKNSNTKGEKGKKSPTKEIQGKEKWYASNRMKQSDGGRGFYKLFEGIFDDCEKVVKSEMVKHYNSSSILKELAFDDTMELFFGEKFEATYHQLIHEYPFQEPDFVLDKAFEKLQSKFDEAVKENFEKSQENWVLGTHDDMNTNLFHYSWNKALNDYYNDERFIAATKNAQAKALDTLFLNLIVTENYFQDDIDERELEAKMIKVYTKLMEEEFVNQSNENGLSEELKRYMEKKWERKFNSAKFSDLDLNHIKITIP